MQVTIRSFATVRERLGEGQFTQELPDGATLRDLVERLAASRPEAATLKDWLESGHLHLARNRVHVPPETLLEDGDEVALFPPVSGG